MQQLLPPLSNARRHDKDKSGFLNIQELGALVGSVTPDATPLDVEHFRAMMDLDGNAQVTLIEFTTALETNQRVSAAVSAMCYVALHHAPGGHACTHGCPDCDCRCGLGGMTPPSSVRCMTT